MTIQNLIEPLKVGTAVKILNSGYSHAQIAEYRGLLGPKGALRLPRSRSEEAPAYTSRFLKTSSRCWRIHK